MKLKTKLLLPILGAGSVAAAITPLVVSCGSSTTADDFPIYVPTIEKARGNGIYNNNSACEMYVNHIKQNPEIFKQDLRHFLSLQVAANVWDFRSTYTYDAPLKYKIDGSISNFSIDYVPYLYGNQFTASYDFVGSIDIDAGINFINMNTYYAWEYSVKKVSIPKFTVHFEQVPFQFAWRTDQVGQYHYSWQRWECSLPSVSTMRESYLPWSIKIQIPTGSIIWHDDNCPFPIDATHVFNYKDETYVYDNYTTSVLTEEQQAATQLIRGLAGRIGKVYHMEDIAYGYY